MRDERPGPRANDHPAGDPMLGRRFDVTAEDYHRLRPRYPDHIIDTLIADAGFVPGSRILELGAGTGIATRALAERGLAIMAIEPGPEMAAIARRELADFPDVTIVESTFEDWVPPRDLPPFDGIVSATAFHWLDRATRLDRCAALLRPGGTLAILSYGHCAGGDVAFFEKAQQCYVRWMPGASADETLPTWKQPVDPNAWDLADHPAFDNPAMSQWRGIVASTRQEYLDLLGTYSGHIALDPERRAGLFSDLGDLIDHEFGGQIAKAYRYELILARRSTR